MARRITPASRAMKSIGLHGNAGAAAGGSGAVTNEEPIAHQGWRSGVVAILPGARPAAPLCNNGILILACGKALK